MSNLNSDYVCFLYCCLTIILVANAAASFGSLISALAPSVNAAVALGAPLLLPLMVCF